MNNRIILIADRHQSSIDKGLTAEQERCVQHALKLLYSSMQKSSIFFGSTKEVKNYLELKLVSRPNEVFVCLYLDSQHCLIEYREHFFGTIDKGVVYPREVVRAALSYNASAVIIAHNHPSGIAEPSQSDRAITERLMAALDLVDVQLLDHLVVGADSITSFVERGLLSNL
jgi:DNA repair protein RadC